MNVTHCPPDPTITIRHELCPGDVGYVTYLHGLLYGRERGWDHTFDAYVAGPLGEFSRSCSSRERIWIVEQGVVEQGKETGEGKTIVGSVAIVKVSEGEAQLRWLLLHPGVRGLGLGRRLVDEAVEFAQGAGYKSLFLWTVRGLEAAEGLYRSAGFCETEEVTHEIWGDLVTEVRYELGLGPGISPPR